jgi:hypothetical protein
MILPTKHLKLSNSILNAGSILIRHIDAAQTITYLWDQTRNLPEIKTFERFILALDFLYILGLIDFKDGMLKKVSQ